MKLKDVSFHAVPFTVETVALSLCHMTREKVAMPPSQHKHWHLLPEDPQTQERVQLGLKRDSQR